MKADCIYKMAASLRTSGTGFSEAILMIDIQNVLCPVDFFPASQRALEYSIGVAQNYTATLHILHVVAPVMPRSYDFSLNTAELL